MSEIITPWPTAVDPSTGEPVPYRMPFYYSAMKTLWAFYKIDIEKGRKHLENTGLQIATFSDGDGETALACINIMAYLTEGSAFGGPTGEIEVNLVAYAEADANAIPRMSWQDFLWGDEQTKRIGFMRKFVLCDNPNAIMAGRSMFGEYKFLTSFNYFIPSLNVNPDKNNVDGTQNLTSWTFTATDAKTDQADNPAVIFTLEVDLAGQSPSSCINQTALLNFSLWDQFTYDQINPATHPAPPSVGDNLKLVGTRRNFLGPFTSYAGWKKASLTYGTSDPYGTVSFLKDVLGDDPKPPCSIGTYFSAPTIIESRAFFPNVRN